MRELGAYAHVWALDFEFGSLPNSRPDVRCMVAHDLCTGRSVRLFGAQLSSPPFGLGEDSLFLSYFATAELSCFHALGWPPPMNLIDMHAEFRALSNGYGLTRYALPDALRHLGLESAAAFDKSENRHLAVRGGPYTSEEQAQLLDYCGRDVRDLVTLYRAMQHKLDAVGAQLRGIFIEDVAAIEALGIPLDVTLLKRFYDQRESIEAKLIAEFDDLELYSDGRFFTKRLAAYIESRYPEWPRTATGLVRVDDKTFEEFSLHDPSIHRLRTLKAVLSQLRGPRLSFTEDGRSRPMLSAFRARTGRNAPSTRSFIFGCPRVMRGFIRPPPGCALAYIDWEAQEMGIAASLSGDKNMLAAYASSDFYLFFARLAGAVPVDATKKSHPRERALYKTVCLAVMYGMGAERLARRTALSYSKASVLLDQHRKLFPRFWSWSGRTVMSAMLRRTLMSSMRWPLHVPAGCDLSQAPRDGEAARGVTVRTLKNFAMQANGADMMRLAINFAHAYGVQICAPVHDGFLIEASSRDIGKAIELMRNAMDRASRFLLGGFALKVDVGAPIHFPDRFPLETEQDRLIWRQIFESLGRS
jgi:DNA polymerase I